MDNNRFTFAAFADLVRQNLKLFILVGVVAAVAGVIFTGPTFMQSLFRSTAVVYPVNIEPYSDESETEQLMQIFQASAIRDTIIARFNLMSRYDVEADAPDALYQLYEEYSDRITVAKTNFESVKLEVVDHDPEVAKAIASEILKQVNIKANKLANEPAYGRMKAIEKQLKYQLAVIDSVDQIMSEMSMTNNVLQYESQTRELMRGYIEVLRSSPNSSAADKIQGLMNNLQKTGSTFQGLQYFGEMATNQYDHMAKQYLEERAMAFQDLTYTNVVIAPEAINKKVYPSRALFTALIVLSALAFTALALVVFKRQ